MTTLPTLRAVVFDAFGTTVHIQNPSRPFTQLRDQLAALGHPVDDFFVQGMTNRFTPAQQADRYGHQLSADQTEELNLKVSLEVQSVVAYPDTQPAVQLALSRGLVVVIGSNLGWPYGAPIVKILSPLSPVSSLGDSAPIQMAFSYDMGCIKPNPLFYHTIADSLFQQYGINRFEIGMIGDKQREDCDAPRLAGWFATQLRRDRSETLITALERLGISQ